MYAFVFNSYHNNFSKDTGWVIKKWEILQQKMGNFHPYFHLENLFIYSNMH